MQPNTQSICIVGTGVRGLGVLERIIAYAKNKKTKRLQVHLVDPATEGPEQYDIRQPDYLLLNIVCGQVSMFPDAVSVNSCPPIKGPSLYEWVCNRGLLISDDGFSVGNNGRPIKADDFLPRRIYGEYLAWFKELLKNECESCIDIIEHKAKATDLIIDANQFIVELSNGSSIDTDYLFLTVGQISEPKKNYLEDFSNRYINRPYPLPEQLKSIKAGETIAIAGLGLTAFDAILALTIGRGGKIEKRDGVDIYIQSGNEPRIVAFSRSGLPYRSRPAIGAPLKYESIVFTRSAIDKLRTTRGLKLDYDNDILPLLFTEMRIAYHRAKYGRDFGWVNTQNILKEFRDSFIAGNLEAHLAKLDSHDSILFDSKFIYFETSNVLNKKDSIPLSNTIAYGSWFRKWLEDDLEESQLGTTLSPLKAALEACREFRDIIRYAVDFGGLTNESSERFFSFHSRSLNRIGVGPQKEHTAAILALVRSGILSIPLGPNPKVAWDKTINKWKLSSSMLQVHHDVFVDWIYSGSSSRIHNISDDSSVVGAMARKNILRRLCKEPSVINAVDIDKFFHPISHSEIPNERIWIMGLLCEGVTFYNGYITSPEVFTHSHHDSDIAVSQIFS